MCAPKAAMSRGQAIQSRLVEFGVGKLAREQVSQIRRRAQVEVGLLGAACVRDDTTMTATSRRSPVATSNEAPAGARRSLGASGKKPVVFSSSVTLPSSPRTSSHGGGTIVGPLGQHAAKQVGQARRHADAPRLDVHGLVGGDSGQGAGGAIGHEGRRAGQALEEDAAEREHVGARVHIQRALRLLGRHVHGRPQGRAGLGQAQRGRVEQAARDAEVEQLDLGNVLARQEDVGGLDVAVDDPVLVGHGQGLRDPADHAHRGAQVDGTAGQPVLQGLAVEPFHDQVVLAVGGLAVGDVAHDGRMGDGGQAVRLLLKALAKLRAEAGRDLHRHGFAGGQIDAPVDHAHAAGDAVAFQAKSTVDLLGHVIRWQHGQSRGQSRNESIQGSLSPMSRSANIWLDTYWLVAVAQSASGGADKCFRARRSGGENRDFTSERRCLALPVVTATRLVPLRGYFSGPLVPLFLLVPLRGYFSGPLVPLRGYS